VPHFGLLPNIKRWSLQVTQKGGNWERRKMVAPSFRTYVKDDLPTPKTSRWFIDMRIETDPNKSMSVATQRMNASLFEAEKVATGSGEQSATFMTQGKDGEEEANSRPDSSLSTTIVNDWVINQLCDTLRQARELTENKFDAEKFQELELSLASPTFGIPPMTASPASLLGSTAAAVRFGHIVNQQAKGVLPPIKGSSKKNGDKKGPGRADARPVTQPPDEDAPASLAPLPSYFNAKPAGERKTESPERGAQSPLKDRIENNIEVLKDWIHIRAIQHAEFSEKAELRQHQALERAQIHEEDAVKDILAKQEKKFRLSEKVLMAQRQPEYRMRVNLWAGSIKALFFARVLHSEYVRRKELKIQLVKSMRAVEVLHRYFRPAFAAYLKRKVDRAFPKRSAARWTMIRWIQKCVMISRRRHVHFVASFLKKHAVQFRWFSVVSALKTEVIKIQRFWNIRYHKWRVHYKALERTFVELESKILTNREMTFLKDTKLMVAAKQQIMFMRGTFEVPPKELKDKIWPFPNMIIEDIVKNTADFLKTPSLQALAKKELAYSKPCSLRVLAANCPKLEEMDADQEKAFKDALIELHIYKVVEPTAEDIKRRLLDELLEIRMKHERFKRKEKFSPLQFGVMQLAHGKADLEPSPEAPFRVVPPKEEMMALVLHGLHSTNAHLAKSSDPLIYSEGPYRRGSLYNLQQNARVHSIKDMTPVRSGASVSFFIEHV